MFSYLWVGTLHVEITFWQPKSRAEWPTPTIESLVTYHSYIVGWKPIQYIGYWKKSLDGFKPNKCLKTKNCYQYFINSACSLVIETWLIMRIVPLFWFGMNTLLCVQVEWSRITMSTMHVNYVKLRWSPIVLLYMFVHTSCKNTSNLKLHLKMNLCLI